MKAWFSPTRATDPSNLQVVEEAGTFEIYVTQADQNVPLILEGAAGQVPVGSSGKGSLVAEFFPRADGAH